MTDPVERTLAYHERTKHHPQRYARALGYMDWATQPDPFRTYAGASRVELPLLADGLATPFANLYQPGTIPAKPANGDTVAVLFELALGISAWKQHQNSRWALRCNPSSGNLHPTEGYAIVPELPGLPPGVYHYVSRDHCLERRCDQAPPLPAGTLLIGLSSIHWREAWKYGERAFRYCQHDVGHAIAAVRYAAAALGWSATLLDHLGDDAITATLGLAHPGAPGLSPHDREHPDTMLLVRTRPGTARVTDLSSPCAAWQGQANGLSPKHVDWEVIPEVAAATWKPGTPVAPPAELASIPALSTPGAAGRAATLIRQRRSCQALDGRTTISASVFFAMLDKLLPRPGVPPWDAVPWPAHLHLGIFVHRVVGLTPGLYLFERAASIHERLRTAVRPEFAWQTVPGCPEHLRLFLLAAGDYRRQAELISCQQDIAADGAFSLGMLADYGTAVRRGAWWYRRLFGEAGMLGQVLYLEAEAAGVRGTGIGCYFDDLFHDLLGLKGDDFQDLYHFTVGGPVDDPRLTTLPAYAHLQRS